MKPNDAGGRMRRRLPRAVVRLAVLPIKALLRVPSIAARVQAETWSVRTTRSVVELPHLPSAFEGATAAFLTDFHCGPLTPPAYLHRVVDETDRLEPDVIVLGGDYVTRGADHVRPVIRILRRLRAPLGVYGVLGNHDYRDDPEVMRSALKRAGVVDVTNSGCWLTRDGSRIRIAGVGDLREDKQDLPAALAGVKEGDAVILLSHNPDFAMSLTDRRVGLMLSGHTHGGQIRLPGLGPLMTRSRYGRYLVSGLVSFDTFQLYISRGLGTVGIPLRYQCPPEVALLTLCRPNLIMS